MFATLFTDIFPVLLFGVGSHVTLRVPFIFVFIVTVIISIPASFTVAFEVTVNISNTFEGTGTTFLWARQSNIYVYHTMLLKMAFKGKSFPTLLTVKLKFLMHITVLVEGRLVVKTFITVWAFYNAVVNPMMSVEFPYTGKTFTAHLALNFSLFRCGIQCRAISICSHM